MAGLGIGYGVKRKEESRMTGGFLAWVTGWCHSPRWGTRKEEKVVGRK